MPSDADPEMTSAPTAAEGPRAERQVSGELLFRFAVVTDTHIRLPEDGRLTPWKGQSMGYERAREALGRMVATQPRFIVHLGDLVQPVPHLPSYARTAAYATELFAGAGLPTYYVPGNHDIGDKMTPVTPAHETDQFSIDAFENAIGSSYQSFDADGIHFAIVNTSLVGTGFPEEARQLEWLRQDLAANSSKRLFLFIHYPLYMYDPTEPSLYDNVEEPGRSKLLELIAAHRVEAVFAGHVHNFFYHERSGTEFYSLLSTCFVRHDYAEMFPVGPTDDFGRDDRAKLGWAEVEIYETGHILHIHRSTAIEIARQPDGAPRFPLPHVKRGNGALAGVHLRGPWASPREISFNSPVDEFMRRQVRNDYNLLGLWEMGVRDVRIPVADLLRPEYRARMRDLAAIGHCFTFFSVGAPDLADADLWSGLRDLGATLEIILSWKDVDAARAALAAVREVWKGPLLVASIVSLSDHRQTTFKGGYATMSFGFDHSECAMLADFHRQSGRDLGLGYVFRIPPEQSPLREGAVIAAFAERENVAVALNVVLGAGLPAAMDEDELATTNRVAEAMFAGAAYPSVMPFIDTYLDHDRGYFPRQGLYDARNNPRPAGMLVKTVHSVLSNGERVSLGEPVQRSGGSVCPVEWGGRKGWLVLPAAAATERPPTRASGGHEAIALVSGAVSSVPCHDGDIDDLLATCGEPTLVMA